MRPRHIETHLVERIGWLRAAVLGANDGIISTASLILGVAAAAAAKGDIMLAGVAGLVAGAMSMAAGEFVSVSSQSDTEKGDLQREKRELQANPERELEELKNIYIGRGLDAALAQQVAVQLTTRDALGSHARDELGFAEMHSARPIQAAWTSAVTFAVGAALPLGLAALVPTHRIIMAVSLGSLLLLAALGGVAARAGGAGLIRGASRVTFWGAFAMALTALVGRIFGAVV